MPYKIDCHIHTTFNDGKPAHEDFISEDVAAGISEIGLSEHQSFVLHKSAGYKEMTVFTKRERKMKSL